MRRHRGSTLWVAAVCALVLAVPSALAEETIPPPEPSPDVTPLSPDDPPPGDLVEYPSGKPPEEPTDASAREAALAAMQARIDRERGRLLLVAQEELATALANRDLVQAAAGQAEADLAAAVQAQQDLAVATSQAELAAGDARRDLGNLARLAYASGPSELTLVASLLDADSPADILRRAAVAQSVAEHQDSQWDAAVGLIGQLTTAQAAAAQKVLDYAARAESARINLEVANAQVAALTSVIADGGIGSTDGRTEVERLCAGKSDIPQCEPSGWGEGNLTRDAVWLMRVTRQLWSEVSDVGGYRATDPHPDHPSGRAVDIMIPGGGRSSMGVALGDQAAAYLMENAEAYGVQYLIWRQRIWVAGKDPVVAPAQWRMMSDRGDWTSNHMDHVHITVTTGVSGSNIYDVLLRPPASAVAQ